MIRASEKTPVKKDGVPLKVATFNANSLRSRLPIVLDWLKKEKPDVLAVQETKVQDAEFPRQPFEDAGWNVVFRGEKSYNGVAFISREPLEKVVDRLHPEAKEENARFIAGWWGKVLLVNTYVPQGFSIDSEKYKGKLKFYSDLGGWFDRNVKSTTLALWMGDLNIAPTDIDVDNPKAKKEHPCFHIDARNAFLKVKDSRWTDLFRQLHPEAGHYTFWDYRFPSSLAANKGWRIDFILGTKGMSEKLKRVWIDKKPRLAEKPSDHTVVAAVFE